MKKTQNYEGGNGKNYTFSFLLTIMRVVKGFFVSHELPIFVVVK